MSAIMYPDPGEPGCRASPAPDPAETGPAQHAALLGAEDEPVRVSLGGLDQRLAEVAADRDLAGSTGFP